MNWFWLIITVIPVAAAVLTTVILCKSIAAHRFKCGNCEGEFKIKWTKVLFTMHSGDEYIIKCPYCRKKGACYKQHGRK